MNQSQQQGDRLVIENQPSQILVVTTGGTNCKVSFHAAEDSDVSSIRIDPIDAVVLNADQFVDLNKFKASQSGRIRECNGQLVLFPENGVNTEIHISGTFEKVNTKSKKEDIVDKAKLVVGAEFTKYAISGITERKNDTGTVSLSQVYFIIFYTNVTKQRINGSLEKNWIWVSSSWIKCCTHANQMNSNIGPYIWLKALDFVIPTVKGEKIEKQSIEWEKLANALDQLWQGHTGHPLSTDDLAFLKKRLRLSKAESVTWKEFCCQNMLNLDFTFLTWFFNTMQFTKKHLCGYEGHVGPLQIGLMAGFISCKDAEERIANLGPTKGVGKCIMRQSESVEGGGISVSCGVLDTNRAFKVISLDPFDENQLKSRSLIDRILDIGITHIYPNVEISEDVKNLFPRSRDKPRANTDDRCIPTGLRMVLEPNCEGLEPTGSPAAPSPGQDANPPQGISATSLPARPNQSQFANTPVQGYSTMNSPAGHNQSQFANFPPQGYSTMASPAGHNQSQFANSSVQGYSTMDSPAGHSQSQFANFPPQGYSTMASPAGHNQSQFANSPLQGYSTMDSPAGHNQSQFANFPPQGYSTMASPAGHNQSQFPLQGWSAMGSPARPNREYLQPELLAAQNANFQLEPTIHYDLEMQVDPLVDDNLWKDIQELLDFNCSKRNQ